MHWIQALERQQAGWQRLTYETEQLPHWYEYLEFVNKESYLDWVRTWKAVYAAVTLEIRALRAELTQPHERYMGLEMNRKRVLRQWARDLLYLRGLGKHRSWELRNKARRGELPDPSRGAA